MRARLLVIVLMLSSTANALAQTCDALHWTPSAPIPELGGTYAIAYDSARGRTVLVGGPVGSPSTQFQSQFPTTLEYDGVSWVRRTTANAPSARTNHAIAYDAARRRIVLFGGSFSSRLSDTWEYDGTNWSQVFSNTNPPARTLHAMVYDSTRRVVVLFGGQGDAGVLGDTWEFDGLDWTQRTTTTNPPPVVPYSMVFDAARGRVVACGSIESTSGLVGTWEYDGTDWTMRTTAHAPSTRSYAAMSYDPVRKRVVLFGGFSGSIRMDLDDTWEYDGTDWIQVAPTVRPGARDSAIATYDESRQCVVLYGGSSQTLPNAHSDLWEYNGTTWVNRMLYSLPTGRYAHSLVYDSARRRIIMVGGSDGVRTTFQTFEYDGTSWTLRSDTRQIQPTTFWAAAAYDASRQRTVVFGGRSLGLYSSQTWENDGTSWVRPQLAGLPLPRWGHAMVYDPVRRRVVLFGGAGDNRNYNDTWEYDGSKWVQRATTNRPPARSFHTMAYDAARQRIVIFGGNADPNTRPELPQLSDTWEFDGTDWTQKFPSTSPPARYAHTMTYDPTRQRVIIFGGISSSSAFSDTWEYDGTTWTKRAALSPPPSLFGPAMVFDDALQRVVMFGGLRPGYYYASGELWFLNSDASSITRQASDRAVASGSYADLNILADGPAPLTYRWRRNDIELEESANLVGTAGNFLRINAARQADAGLYTCAVTDGCGRTFVSNPAAVSVSCAADFNSNGTRDVSDIFAFLRAWYARDPIADFDASGEIDRLDIVAFLTLWFAGC